jgi:penicillin-binding protein 2
MLQMAQATATLANDGVKMRPHLVRELVDAVTRERSLPMQPPGQPLPLKPENIAVIKNAMVGVNLEGTSSASFRNAPYTSAGKTGTAQVVQIKQNEKYNAARVDELHRDHALFIAFAPAESPQVALAMVVENVGFGAQFAAPIARRVFDYVLKGLYPSEEDIEAVQNGQATMPIGKARLAADVAWPPKP